MCKPLPLIFLKILLQNCCFSCHFLFCPPLVRGILFVMVLQLFFGEEEKKFVDFYCFGGGGSIVTSKTRLTETIKVFHGFVGWRDLEIER